MRILGDFRTIVIINISLVTEMLYREWNVCAKYLLLDFIHILCLWSPGIVKLDAHYVWNGIEVELLSYSPTICPVFVTYTWPVSQLRQRPYGGCNWIAKDAHSSMVRDPTSYYFRDPWLISSWYFSFGFWFWTLSVITTFHGCVSKSHISKRWIIKSSLDVAF